jgi:Fe-S cluster assembly scaffold protein SufB
MSSDTAAISNLGALRDSYKYGFVTDIESDTAPPGLNEAGVAVDAVFDSVSVATTFRATLGEAGIIFCPFSEAVREHPDLVQEISRLRRAGRAIISSPR